MTVLLGYYPAEIERVVLLHEAVDRAFLFQLDKEQSVDVCTVIINDFVKVLPDQIEEELRNSLLYSLVAISTS